MKGYFGEFGGQYVPETLLPALEELEEAMLQAFADDAFSAELQAYLSDYVWRPTPLTHALRLSAHYGCDVWLKREDLTHTGSHKINNAIGQILLARRMGKRRVIAETGAGQHGVATATVCALFGMECRVYMGSTDMARQRVNVERMRLLGAEVSPVESGGATLKEATSEAIRDWIANVDTTYYLIGSAIGPHPYPTLVRELQAVIGREAKAQFETLAGGLPDAVVACVGGGSNAIGIFSAFLDEASVELFGVEAYGEGNGRHGASINFGYPGVLHGTRSMLLQDKDGQVCETHSVAAGLDYPGVGPEHSHLAATKRASYRLVTDEQALAAFRLLGRLEGIVPALESAHAIAFLEQYSRQNSGRRVLVNLSGRGDKDVHTVFGGAA